MNAPEEAPLLDEALLSAIRGLDRPARRRAARPVDGIHRNFRRGHEEDFFEHRPYVIGDDRRAIDWRASARSSVTLVRQRHASARRPLTLFVDDSESMNYPLSLVAGETKLRRAKVIAAALAFRALSRGDRVDVFELSGTEFRSCARLYPRHGARHSVEASLSNVRPRGRGDLARALEPFCARLSAVGIAFVLSDLYGETVPLLAALRRLRSGGSEIVAVHILSEAELAAPRPEATLFDLETGERRSIDATAIRDYGARLERWRFDLGKGAEAAGVEFFETAPAESAAESVRRLLSGTP